MTFIDIIFKTYFHENRSSSAKGDMGTKKQRSQKPSCFRKEGNYCTTSLYKCTDIFTTIHRSRATVFLFLDFISWRKKVNSCCLCLCISASPFQLSTSWLMSTNLQKVCLIQSICELELRHRSYDKGKGGGLGTGSARKAWVLSIHYPLPVLFSLPVPRLAG
jgi:hypothetical protein